MARICLGKRTLSSEVRSRSATQLATLANRFEYFIRAYTAVAPVNFLRHILSTSRVKVIAPSKISKAEKKDKSKREAIKLASEAVGV